MNQDLIVYIIVLSTVGLLVFNFIKNAKTKKINNCQSGCSGCELSKHRCGCDS